MMDFGERLRSLRKKRGLTMVQLAELAGSSQCYIWQLENKNRARPSANKVASIAVALGVTTDYLLDSEETITINETVDNAFYKRYLNLSKDKKEKIRKMLDILAGE